MADSKLKVVELLPRDSSNCTDLIEMLEAVIERAKAGKIYGVGIVCLGSDKSVSTAWSKGCSDDMFTLIGGIEGLKYRAVNAIYGKDD